LTASGIYNVAALMSVCVDWLSRDCWRNHSTASFHVGIRAEDGAARQALAVSAVCRRTLRDNCLQGFLLSL